MQSFVDGNVEYGENRPPLSKKCAKNRPFFLKSRTYELQKTRPLFSEIQNDDAYLLYVGVAGPGNYCVL